MLQAAEKYDFNTVILPDISKQRKIAVSLRFAKYSLKTDQVFLLPYTENIETSTYTHIVHLLHNNIKNTIIQEDNMVYCISAAQEEETYNCYTFAFESTKDAKCIYKLHKAKLLKVISQFQSNIESFMESPNISKKKVSFLHKNTLETQRAKKQYNKKVVAVYPEDEPTDREFEVLILYASGGFTASEIATKFNVTTRTIEAHLEVIRDKTACRNRSAMKQYLIERGWDCLERFYLSQHTNA